MVGIELVTDRKLKTPAKEETAVLFESLRGTFPDSWITLFNCLTNIMNINFHEYRTWSFGRKRRTSRERFQDKAPYVFLQRRRRYTCSFIYARTLALTVQMSLDLVPFRLDSFCLCRFPSRCIGLCHVKAVNDLFQNLKIRSKINEDVSLLLL